MIPEQHPWFQQAFMEAAEAARRQRGEVQRRRWPSRRGQRRRATRMLYRPQHAKRSLLARIMRRT